MSVSEYVLIFLSLITGVIVFSFVSGWSKMIRNWSEMKFSGIHFVWSLILFAFLIFAWLKDYNYWMSLLNDLNWSPVAVARPIILFFCVEILFPPDPALVDFSSHFKIAARKFYLMVTILFFYEIVIRIIRGLNLFEMPRIFFLIDFLIVFFLFLNKNRKYDWIGTSLIILSSLLQNTITINR